ncbi:MAG: hypothetical protein MUF54_25830 [Polyangiaceae bacterium]|nr:hypothetical protein [Polyangiaceae bacterium]
MRTVSCLALGGVAWGAVATLAVACGSTDKCEYGSLCGPCGDVAYACAHPDECPVGRTHMDNGLCPDGGAGGDAGSDASTGGRRGRRAGGVLVRSNVGPGLPRVRD